MPMFSTQRSQRLGGAEILRAILNLCIPEPLVPQCLKTSVVVKVINGEHVSTPLPLTFFINY
jgi:hypothetical protein